MRFFGTTLPLGLDLSERAVSLAVLRRKGGGAQLLQAESTAVETREGAVPEDALEHAVCTLLGRLRTRERRCIVAAPAEDIVTGIFRPPGRMRRSERLAAARLAAATWSPLPESERTVRVHPLPGQTQLFVAVARTSALRRIVALARKSGLRPVAVDAPICAWHRIACDADALLDLRPAAPTLTVFGRPIGFIESFGARLALDRLGVQIRTALATARREALADVRRVAVVGDGERRTTLTDLLLREGYTPEPLRFGEVENPPWAFAFALASWSAGVRAGT